MKYEGKLATPKAFVTKSSFDCNLKTMSNIQKGFNNPLIRTKSMSSFLTNDDGNEEKSFISYIRHSRTLSESSVEVSVVYDSESDHAVDYKGKTMVDSGIDDKTLHNANDTLAMLDLKVDKLMDMCQEQSRRLKSLNEDFRNLEVRKENLDHIDNQFLKNAFLERFKDVGSIADIESGSKQDTCAQSQLDAMDIDKAMSLDRMIMEVLTSLLLNEELKDQIVKATAESVKGVIEECISRDIVSLYLPILERFHCRHTKDITKVVEDSFIDLPKNISKAVTEASTTLFRALERHQTLLVAASDPGKNILQCTVEELLQKELKQHRQQLLDVLSSEQHLDSDSKIVEAMTPLNYTPISPLQPNDWKISSIDQLMMVAEINKKIEDGDVNGSFLKALSASNLSLVMTACRAADSANSLYCLDQPVLLSLMQQLSTDMVHETELKCRYLEDAIINLDCINPATREHVPLVVGEVRKHLSSFLSSYPRHVASRRIKFIIMATDMLLK